MAHDTRRVQTAVLGSPDSDYPLSLPMDREEAAIYLSRYKGKPFYCGRLLGGCGWRLMDKLYSDRVCHFAHYPDPNGSAPECERRYFGADSADHLYIHRGLTSGLSGPARKQQFDGTITQGRCTDLLVNPGRSRSAIRVQFVNLPPDVWAKEDEELRARLGWVDWMVGPRALATGKYLLDRDGYALRVRCEQQGSTRVVKIGTETQSGDLEWAELKDCEISERGIVTPLLRKLRSAAPRQALSTTRLPGFPLDVDNIVVYPQENRTRPTEGPGIRQGSHAAAADVQIGDGERIHVRIVVPARVDLLVGEPHALVKPASVDATKGNTHTAPVWTIFSTGIRPIRPINEPSSARTSTTQSASAATQAPKPPEKKTIDTAHQPKGLTRHRLTSLIQSMRQARRERDHRRLLQLLAVDTELVKELMQPPYRKERQAVEELRRWATTREQAYRQTEQEVRERSATLLRQIDQAKADGDLNIVQREIDTLRKTLARVSLSNPQFAAEVQALHERESWLRHAQSERVRIRAREAQAESIRAQQHDRLRDVLDRLRKAELAGETDKVRKLLSKGRSLLKKLGAHATPYEKRQLNLAVQRLAAVPVDSKAKVRRAPTQAGISSPYRLADRMTVLPRGTTHNQATRSLRDVIKEVSARLATVLQEVACDQTTISMPNLAGKVGAEIWLCTSALVEIDKAAGNTGPLLSALVTAPDGSVHPDFGDILAGLNYEVPQTDQALHRVWKREVARTHAFYANPPREVPTSLISRKTGPTS